MVRLNTKIPYKQEWVVEISAYFYIAKMRILVSLAYRFEVFSSMVSNFIIMLSTVFFWKVAFNGMNSVSGVNMRQMITYSIVAALLGTIFSFRVENVINERIREGDIAVDFIKPVSTFGLYFAQDIGNIFSSIVQKFLPLLLFVLIFVQVPTPASWMHFTFFLVSSLFGYAILWLMSGIVGLTAFWIIDLGPVGFVKDVIVRIFSGSVIPIWFFPQNFQNVLKFLPFIYTYQLPCGVYIGKISLPEACQSVLIQLLWTGVLFVLFYSMQKRVGRKLLIQGG